MVLVIASSFSPALAGKRGRTARPPMPVGRAVDLALWAPLVEAGAGILTAPAPVAAAARQREAARGGLLTGITYLEQRSVGKATLADYQRRARAFVDWCSSLHLDWNDWPQLDTIVVTYFDFLHFHGHSGDDASRLLAALKFFLPPIGRWGDQTLCRASRSLAGWGKCAPRRMRMPLPWLVVAALAGVMLGRGQVEQVIAMILSFACYLRPSECDLLTAMQVVAPVEAAARASGLAALLLHPGELGRPGKTGLWDFTVVLDTYVFLVPALLGLKRRAASPKARLWSFPPASLSACMREAAAALGLADFPVAAYGLRHGGASDDLLAKRRQALEVQQRGGWASDKNFRRYAKQARIITELQRAGRRVISYGQEMDKALQMIFLSGAPVPVLSPISPGQ